MWHGFSGECPVDLFRSTALQPVWEGSYDGVGIKWQRFRELGAEKMKMKMRIMGRQVKLGLG